MTDDTTTDPTDEASSGPSLTTSDVREYHTPLAETLAPLGDLDGNPTLLVNDNFGWYVTRDNQTQNGENTEEFPKERRVRHFTNDFNRVVSTRLERTLYGLTSYKYPGVFERWEPARFDEEKEQYEYASTKPTPKAADVAAVSVWGDIDLADDLKSQRPDLDAPTYEVAERTYDAYIDAFADLYDGRDAVYILDSVGGAYIFGAPEATLPIARYYEDDPDARARVFAELIDRSNDYLREAEQRINKQVDGASEVVHPDWANNINRQYKLPLTLHADHDAVVTPVDVDDVRYREPLAVEDADDDVLREVNEWCEAFTALKYEDRVADLVAALWPDEFEEHSSWEAALDAWVEAQRERERRETQRRQAAVERREQRLEELEEGVEGQPITPFLQDVYDALDAIDTAEVVRRYASDEWDTGADMPGKTEFNPSWRSSKSGRSCYVNHETNRFGDPGDGGGGYAAKAMALGKGIISSASDDLTGEQWAKAVDALRDAGYEVPIWTPERGSHRRDGSTYDRMPFWAMRVAAVALGVLPEDGFTARTTDDGTEYLGFPSADTYNAALDAIETIGLDHGRERASGTRPLDETDISDIPSDLGDVEPVHVVELSDEELLNKARDAANGREFKRLWAGNTSEYGSQTVADIALCSQLAFWTAGDPGWIDRLFRESNLMHDDWDDRDESAERTYGEQIIATALARTTNHYGTGGRTAFASGGGSSDRPASTDRTPAAPVEDQGTSSSSPSASPSEASSPPDSESAGETAEEQIASAEPVNPPRSGENHADSPSIDPTEIGVDQTILQEQITDAHQRIDELETRLDEQHDLLTDVFEHLETISRQLANRQSQSGAATDEREVTSEGSLRSESTDEPSEEDESDSVFSQARRMFGRDE